MPHRRSLPAVAFAALVLAACGTEDAPVSPQPREPGDGRAPGPQVGRLTSDDELARLAREQIPGFAGYYLRDDGTPVLRLVDASQRAKAEAWLADGLARTRVGRNARPFRATAVLPATYDFAQLRGWADALQPLLGRDDVYLIDVDEVENRVSLGVRDAAAIETVWREAARLGIPNAAVRATIQPRPEPRNPRLRQAVLAGGIQIQSAVGLCTYGFNATRVVNGQPIFVTNSHCTPVYLGPDGGVVGQPSLAAADIIGNEVADVAGPRFADAAYISWNGSRPRSQGGIVITNPIAFGGPGGGAQVGEYDIVSRWAGAIVPGLILDKQGRTSYGTFGQVLASCVNIGPFICQDVSDVWSEPGDSGSPMFVWVGGTNNNDVHLYGILWGGPAGNFNITYSSRLPGIEADLGALTNLCRPGFGC